MNFMDEIYDWYIKPRTVDDPVEGSLQENTFTATKHIVAKYEIFRG